MNRWLLIFLCLCAIGLTLGACKSEGEPSAPAEEEPEATAETAPPVADAAEPEATRPDPLAPYAEHLLQRAFAVGMVRTAALTTELARELDAAASGELAAPVAASQEALVETLGPFEALLRPEGWSGHGLDAQRALAFVLTTGPSGALRSAFSELSAKFAAVEQVMDLVYAAGEARSAADDTKVNADADALEARIDEVGFGVRVIVPVSDAEQALATLGGMLEGAGFTAAAEPHPSYQASYHNEQGVPVLLRTAGDVIIADAAWFPGLTDDAEAHRSAARGLVDSLEPGKVTLPVELPGDALGTLTLDTADIVRLEYLEAVEASLADIDTLLALGRGKRLEAGNKLLDEIKQLKVSIALLDELVRRGPFTSWRITVHPREQATAPLRVVSSGIFKEPLPELAGVDLSGPALQPAGAFLGASLSPSIAAESGPWADAGLGAGRVATPENLFKGALLEQLPEWMGHPAMLGLWLYPMPAAAWRDLVPGPIKALDPTQVERIQLALGLDGAGPAVAILDEGAQPSLWQHALACAAQGQPAGGTCDDSAVAQSGTATVTFGKTPVATHFTQREATLVVAAAPAPAPAETLASAPLDTARGAFDATLDFTVVESAALPAQLSASASEYAQWLRKLSLVATLQPEASVWTLEVDSDYALLLGLHGLLDTLPQSPPSIATLVSLSLAGLYDHQPIEMPEPRKRTTSAERKAKAVDPSKLKAINAVFDQKRPQVEKCVRRIMQKFGAGSGELSVMVYINADGSVEKVRVRKDDVGHGLGGCVSDAIKDWKFEPQGDYVSVGKTWKF